MSVGKLLRKLEWYRPSPSMSVLKGGLLVPAPTCPICTVLETLGCHDEDCELGQVIVEYKLLKERIVETLEWMVADMKWKFGQLGPEGWMGGYSPELTKAIALLNTLKGEK